MEDLERNSGQRTSGTNEYAVLHGTRRFHKVFKSNRFVLAEHLRQATTLARSFSTVGWIPRVLPCVLDDQAEQRQSFLLLVDNFPRQNVELGLQASRTAVNVQHVREQHKIHRADRTTVIDAHIE